MCVIVSAHALRPSSVLAPNILVHASCFRNTYDIHRSQTSQRCSHQVSCLLDGPVSWFKEKQQLTGRIRAVMAWRSACRFYDTSQKSFADSPITRNPLHVSSLCESFSLPSFDVSQIRRHITLARVRSINQHCSVRLFEPWSTILALLGNRAPRR